MRKAAVILLLFLYTLSTTGTVLHIHFCMDKYAGWSLFKNGKSCSSCGMKKTKARGCCKDTQTLIQVKDAHNKPFSAISKSNIDIGLPLLTDFACEFQQIAAEAVIDRPVTEQVRRSAHPLYLLNSVYLI